MADESYDIRRDFERGVVILSLDTEQIWGHLDLLSDAQFRQRYPDAIDAHLKLLGCLEQAGISATWLLVGGMALRGCRGPSDPRIAGLPYKWTRKVPDGEETTEPLWYRRSFVSQLRDAQPAQEIGLHGGLTHFIWTDPLAAPEVVDWELKEGIRALEQLSIRPRSFSFARDREAYHHLLPMRGLRCYRGRTVSLAFRLGQSAAGKLARLVDELRCATPPPVWPEEVLPALWNIPSSLFLYPIARSRTRVAGLRSRIERFRLGIDAAARHRGIFHFCLHPENLAESPHGFPMFEEMLNQLIRARDRGDVEVLTMSEMAVRMERARGREPGHIPEFGSDALRQLTLLRSPR